ncbi:hypothetical protein F511_05361 [Dorcoceras hygrometricum]|uniref:Uncharacterized protein n=1 Tax=Dorcoceras hygrometricum TaxID=472368 RepID=A0A2Z7ATI4_9LAMI|nr:hypothetical protein F511_05361 [Dorcoceras hygrometricum]
MNSKVSFRGCHLRQSPYFTALPNQKQRTVFRIVCCGKGAVSSNSPPPPAPPPPPTPTDDKFGFRQVRQYLEDKRPKLNDVDFNIQESVNQWLENTQRFFNEVASPLVKNVNERSPDNLIDDQDMVDFLVTEQTIDSETPSGELSDTAIFSIEQFSCMNGLTGQKMQKIFKALVSESVYNDPRSLLEYCCFRFLSRNNAEVHPSLKEPAFQRLIFMTMIAWENPYSKRKDNKKKLLDKTFLQKKFVGEEAFARIAPAVSGVADHPTVHNLFKALAGDDQGISFGTWLSYIKELLRVHEGRKSYQFPEVSHVSEERILCLASSRKHPVMKWENNLGWPGKLTLTDGALYFEAVNLFGVKDVVRLDLTRSGSSIEKTRVGPLGSNLFDSAISVSTSPEHAPLVLEFVDIGGGTRRDVWYAFINEVIALHKFINEFGPEAHDPSVYDIYGAQKGKDRAVTHAVNSIARLQALQYMRRSIDEPTKLVQFLFLWNAPYGNVVLQTLAVNCWGGAMIKKLTEGDNEPDLRLRPIGEVPEGISHVYDVDGSVYLRKWMRSASWASNVSLAFWRNTSSRGVVLSKNLVVADMTLVEKAAMICRDKFKLAEKTQATIDAAMIEGIPSNIDLFKELLFPLTCTARSFERLRRWDDPLVTASFLGLVSTLIFRNLMVYVLPVSLMILATSMLLLKGLKQQGRLGRFFGKVTIRDQPPSNTIQKLIAVKEAIHELEKSLQNVNVMLLKIRTIILAGDSRTTTEVALVLLLVSTVLLLVPFKYTLAFVIFDFFTRELEFRRDMVVAFNRFLKERWDTIPASPVAVLPFEEEESDTLQKKEKKQIGKVKSERTSNSN